MKKPVYGPKCPVFEWPPSHLILPFVYQTTILSGIQVFGIPMVTVLRCSTLRVYCYIQLEGKESSWDSNLSINYYILQVFERSLYLYKLSYLAFKTLLFCLIVCLGRLVLTDVLTDVGLGVFLAPDNGSGRHSRPVFCREFNVRDTCLGIKSECAADCFSVKALQKKTRMVVNNSDSSEIATSGSGFRSFLQSFMWLIIAWIILDLSKTYLCYSTVTSSLIESTP